jgi:hypothetical protein
MEQNKSEAIQTFRTLALSVTHAIIPTNPSNVHWRYGIVDLTQNIITLDDPMGSDPHPGAIVQDLEILNTLKRLEYVAAGIRAAQGKEPVIFQFRVRIDKTQMDGYQCGAHAVANILLFGGGQADCRASTVVAQDIRLWMAFVIWLHSSTEIALPQIPERFASLFVDNVDIQVTHTGTSKCTPCPPSTFEDQDHGVPCIPDVFNYFLQSCTGAPRSLKSVTFSRLFNLVDLEALQERVPKIAGGLTHDASSSSKSQGSMTKWATVQAQQPSIHSGHVASSPNVQVPRGIYIYIYVD